MMDADGKLNTTGIIEIPYGKLERDLAELYREKIEDLLKDRTGISKEERNKEDKELEETKA